MQEVEIRVSGHLDEDWSSWLAGLSVAHTEDGQTVLAGRAIDQSSLYGLLEKLSGLGLRLISVAVAAPSRPSEEVGDVKRIA